MSDNKFPKFNFNMEYETYNPPRQFTPIPANREMPEIGETIHIICLDGNTYYCKKNIDGILEEIEPKI